MLKIAQKIKNGECPVLCFFGDSITDGQFEFANGHKESVRHEEWVFWNILRNRIREEIGQEVSIVNAGVGGNFSKDGLARLDYRMTWEDAFLAYLKKLEEKKPVIFCGDLNVAHKEIDLKNPKTNRKNAGFTDEERGKFTDLLNDGFIDTWRYFYPDTEGIYSWWSYRFKAREKNAGWRIDYFCVSESLKDELESAKIHTEVFGSDHCPVELVIKK